MAFDLDEKFIKAAEEKLGRNLPDSYRSSMMKNNGGAVFMNEDDWQLHPVLDTSDRKRISRTSNDILRENEMAKDWPNWPENALAIGANGSGDAILFMRNGEVYNPQVFAWDHETGDLIPGPQDFSELDHTN